MAQSTPSETALSSSWVDRRSLPPTPTPQGTSLNMRSMSSAAFGLTSSYVRSVRIRRTPQFMSYPTPPGVMIPSSMSKAATPPMGKP